jgi:O-antigen/teichoic acid export membrane protein
MRKIRLVNFKSDLFATTAVFIAHAAIRLVSSLITTRLLPPEAYGVTIVLMSIVFVVEMLADIGITVFVVRDKHAEEPRYLNTAWTMRLARAVINTGVLFLLGPLIASTIYHTPALATPLRVFSLWFITSGLESMAFPIAIRRKNSRLVMYSELATTLVTTLFSVVYIYFSRDYWGMIFGTLLGRVMITLLSYQFYKELRPRLTFDWAAAKEILGFTKFTMPSSILTLALSQFDKVVFLRLFDLSLMGVYGLAGSIAGPVESLITKISQMVLYPRSAHDFRTERETASTKYYIDNVKLFLSIMFLPAAIGGAARFVITVLYPSRYGEAAAVLQAFMLRAAILSLSAPAEDFLVASGKPQVMLISNVLRACWLLGASILGYYLFGFIGFVYGAALCGLPSLVYLLWLQQRNDQLNVRYEAYKVLFLCVIGIAAYGTSTALLAIWPDSLIRHTT